MSELIEVAEKYKHLFQGSCFNFEGLEAETENAFVTLVKEMGAEVSKDAAITFVQKSYFQKKGDGRKDNLYDINYIEASVQAAVALDLNDYMLVPKHNRQISNHEPTCYAARYIYKTDSCHKCYYNEIFCKKCTESNQESPRTNNQGEHHIIPATDSSSESEEEITRSPHKKVVKRVNTSQKRLISSESEQYSADEEQINSNYTKKSPARKKMKNSSNADNTRNRSETPEIDIENNSSNANSVNNSSEEQVEEPMKTNFVQTHNGIKQKIFKEKNDVDDIEKDDDLSDNFTTNESNTEINENKKLPQKVTKVSVSKWIHSSKLKSFPSKEEESHKLLKSESASDVSLDTDDEEEKYFREKLWWMQHDIPDKERCTIPACSFEPVPHRTHLIPKKFLSMVEKKILVKYLIMRDMIDSAKGKVVYENMIKEGYLSHRSWETLRNSLRRTIVKEIESYKLDADYVKEFKKLRIKHHTVKVKKEKY